MYAAHVNDLLDLSRTPAWLALSNAFTKDYVTLPGGTFGDIIAMCAPDIDRDRITAIRDVVALKGMTLRIYEQGPRGGWKQIRK